MTIRVYTKDDCTACVNTKRYLDRAGVLYEEADLMEPDNLDATKALGHMSAPVVVAGDDHWSGFRPGRIQAVIDRLNQEASE